ncbi:MAG: hypothetical protein WA432_04795 [Candidatus Babeliaceae bacterium]
MHEKVHIGIVLRSYFPSKHKIILFDDELGKIQAVCTLRKFNALMHASLLWYIRKDWQTMHQITYYDLIALPDFWVLSDIYFMHHILELSMFFLPFHKNMATVYELFMSLYKPCRAHNISLYKKIFIYHFFSLMGVYPEEYSKYDPGLICLISKPDDIMLNVQDNDVLQAQLTQWIHECIKVHPQKDQFKTSNFLKYMD